MNDFDYLQEGNVYLDSACQSLRPRPVIAALNEYYETHNSCGERVKYEWGKITDEKVAATREKFLKYLKLKPKKYTVSFTLNTTYGLNLVLSQIRPEHFRKIMTSDIEHNSPFLSTMAFAKRTGLPREIIERAADGSIDLEAYDFEKAIVVVNCVSNFDGRKLLNLVDLVKKVHRANGIVVVDAAQALAHSADLLQGTEADVICTSAHKMYGPSLGVIIWRDELLEYLDYGFVGGGMVDDVLEDEFIASAENKEHRYTRFEAGLQAWGEIVATGAALDWLSSRPKADWENLHNNVTELYEFLASSPKAHLVGSTPDSSTMSFYVENLDSHLLGDALSREGIMARTGYFCAHYYLDHVLHLPPLVRFSLGLHNRPSDIEKVKQVLAKVLK